MFVLLLYVKQSIAQAISQILYPALGIDEQCRAGWRQTKLKSRGNICQRAGQLKTAEIAGLRWAHDAAAQFLPGRIRYNELILPLMLFQILHLKGDIHLASLGIGLGQCDEMPLDIYCCDLPERPGQSAHDAHDSAAAA